MHILLAFAFTAAAFTVTYYKTRSLIALAIPAGYLFGFFL